MVHAHFTLDTKGFKHTLRICNTYCFCTATMLTRRQPDIMLCYAMLCYVMLYYAILCYAMLFYAMLCYAMLFYAVVWCGVVWCGVLCCGVLCCVVLCCVVLCCVVLCCAMICYVMLCYVVLTHIACRCAICLFLNILIAGIFGNIPTWDIVHFSVFKIKITTQPFWDRILPLRNSKKVKEHLRRAQEEKIF